MKLRWPKEVPILTARNMHKGSFSHQSRDDCHCLFTWSMNVFPVASSVRQMIRKTIRRKSIVSFNDDPRNSKSTLARVWNRAMAKLGYVVGNPEAKRKRKT